MKITVKHEFTDEGGKIIALTVSAEYPDPALPFQTAAEEKLAEEETAADLLAYCAVKLGIPLEVGRA